MKNLLLFALMIFFISCSDQKSQDQTKKEGNHPIETDKKNAEPVKTAYSKYGIKDSAGLPEGLSVGDTAPMFVKQAHDGSSINLEKMLEEGPVVLQFYRGQWCPICTRSMANFQDSLQLILDQGAQVVAVGPESKENALIAVEKAKVQYPIIPDYSLEVMDQYRVSFEVTDEYTEKVINYASHNLADNGSGVSKLPVPATYVIGQDKTIKFVQFDPDYSNRASVNEILKHL